MWMFFPVTCWFCEKLLIYFQLRTQQTRYAVGNILQFTFLIQYILVFSHHSIWRLFRIIFNNGKCFPKIERSLERYHQCSSTYFIVKNTVFSKFFPKEQVIYSSICTNWCLNLIFNIQKRPKLDKYLQIMILHLGDIENILILENVQVKCIKFSHPASMVNWP